MSKWFRAGSVSVTQGSKIVTGTLTYWLTAANKPLAGDVFTDNNKIYEVVSIGSDTSLTLDREYEGDTNSELSYGIILSTSGTTNTRIAGQVATVLENLGDKITVSTTAPSPSQGKDGDIWIVAVTN